MIFLFDFLILKSFLTGPQLTKARPGILIVTQHEALLREKV